ncbi:nuclear transport factor 2 family protein [Saccharopolyspora rhizosphaerae]|uniref:Nuclear transport factor 2 family protein n=1 Tax=Saccharopolyspora rhizosphaerae TaxID=2492662 RepID=A0A3R8Q4B9_9PSEU|nr:nuclear transport factor 2 family protein [Saccharopolyspora rhizosphaerae]RRO16637.1 nuclear transport factor 2 family protein [Saccharopolyspora rhizosphaerae]
MGTDAVIDRELRLLEPEVRADAEAVRALLHPDFREFGASGAVWDRETIVRATEASSSADERIEASGFRATPLGPDAVLLTCTTRYRGSSSLRTSVWVRSAGDWLLLHHQGTRTSTP